MLLKKGQKMNSLAAQGKWNKELEKSCLKLNNIYLITPNKLNKRFYYYLPKVLSTKKIKFLQVRSKKLSKVKLLNHIKNNSNRKKV